MFKFNFTRFSNYQKKLLRVSIVHYPHLHTRQTNADSDWDLIFFSKIPGMVFFKLRVTIFNINTDNHLDFSGFRLSNAAWRLHSYEPSSVWKNKSHPGSSISPNYKKYRNILDNKNGHSSSISTETFSMSYVLVLKYLCS